MNSEFSSKTRVLYLNHSGQMSGAEASLRSLLRGIRQSDAAIEPILALPGEGPFSEILRDEGYHVTLAPLRRLNRPRGVIEGISCVLHVMQTAPHICRLAESCGAQIIHSNTTTAHLVGGVAAQKTGKPAVWHCRDLVSLQKIAPQLAAKAAKIIAISECVRAQLEGDGVPSEKIVVVPNGLDTDEWRPRESSQLRQTLGIGPEKFLFGVVGQLVPWKNHAAFIEAAAKVFASDAGKTAHFCILGGDLWGQQSDYVAQLRALVKRHDLAAHFNFIPNQSDAVDAMSALDCLVHPALDEPFGRVLMEAMALQKPVVAMNQNGPREILTHGTDGLLVEADAGAQGLAEAMLEILEHPALREHLVFHSRKTVESRFHVLEHATKIGEIYRELI